MRVLRIVLTKELRVLRFDKMFWFFLVAFPLLLVALLTDAIDAFPEVESGVNFTLPSYSILFGFYIITFIGISHYREHGWGVWDVLRTSGLTRPQLVFSVVAPYYLLALAQSAVLFGAGFLVLGVDAPGSWAGLILVIVVTQLVAVSLGLALINLTSHLASMQQLTHLIVLMMGAAAGGLVPQDLTPGWTKGLARVAPQYWSLEAVHDLIDGSGLQAVLPNIAVLAITGVLLLGLAAVMFDPTKQRRLAFR